MGGEHAFAAEVVVLRAKPTGQVGTIRLLDSATGSHFAAGFSCEVTAFTTTPKGRMHFVGVKFVPIIFE
jgi:hypothetical protein